MQDKTEKNQCKSLHKILLHCFSTFGFALTAFGFVALSCIDKYCITLHGIALHILYQCIVDSAKLTQKDTRHVSKEEIFEVETEEGAVFQYSSHQMCFVH